jgi:hypothetical protein
MQNLQWANGDAVGLLFYWKAAAGMPQEANIRPRGYVKWSAADLAGKRLLGHPIPFSSVSVHDRDTQNLIVKMYLPVSASAAQRLSQVSINVISYDPASKMLTLTNNNIVGLFASLFVTYRIIAGSLAPNAAFGAYVSMNRRLRDSRGSADVTRIKEEYDSWYKTIIPVAPVAPHNGGTTGQERFALGLSHNTTAAAKTFGSYLSAGIGALLLNDRAQKERLSSVTELIEAQKQYQRATQAENFSESIYSAEDDLRELIR